MCEMMQVWTLHPCCCALWVPQVGSVACCGTGVGQFWWCTWLQGWLRGWGIGGKKQLETVSQSLSTCDVNQLYEWTNRDKTRTRHGSCVSILSSSRLTGKFDILASSGGKASNLNFAAAVRWYCVLWTTTKKQQLQIGKKKPKLLQIVDVITEGN